LSCNVLWETSWIGRSRLSTGSLYFERSGLSKDKEKLAARVKAGAETFEPRLAVRDPSVFEFLGLRSREVMGESDLEDALLDRRFMGISGRVRRPRGVGASRAQAGCRN
jgi:predicted nuclease of restriction endonuclease-like (RecB) superfamily